MSTGAAEPQPTILIGQRPVCGAGFRAEIPASRPVVAVYATAAAQAADYPIRHDCRTGVRCPEDAASLPACGDSNCGGHAQTEIKYRSVRITYKPDAMCGPGNCWN